MRYQTYASLYSLRDFALPLFGVKIGHSQNSIKRCNEMLSNMDLQDLIVLRDVSKTQARKVEDTINRKLVRIFSSGGSSEFHVIPIEKFSRVYNLLCRELGSMVAYQPHARAVSNEVLFQDGWPTRSRLKKNYVA